MRNVSNQRPVRDNSLSRDIISYVVNKKKNAQGNKISDMINDNHKVQTPVKRPVNTVNLYQNIATKSNIRIINIKRNKSLEFQVLFGELESLLLSMNRNDATVQRALIKLNEIRTRVFPELKKAEEYDEVIKS